MRRLGCVPRKGRILLKQLAIGVAGDPGVVELQWRGRLQSRAYEYEI